ncbi:MAG TPA: hypothetical protein VK213_01980 [Bacteroidales bacterium]|nr:hypothetical protein [Bacteroidales bacterium]
MENNEKYRNIKGWGVDTDPRNEPTYPMKDYTGDDHKKLNYERPKQQLKNIEVLHSNERPSISSVFGTSMPPSGLSGLLRRLAFRYSESSFGHWFPLIFADRINVWEGYIKDFGKGKLPNIFKERGWGSELKYNKKKFVTRSVIRVATVAFVVAFILGSSRKRKRRKH